MEAALLAMIAALLAAVLASVFDQRRESTKTRDAIQLLSTQVAALTATNTVQSQQLIDLKHAHEENHRTTQAQLGQINASLGNARERLARIEGHLTIGSSNPEEVEAST